MDLEDIIKKQGIDMKFRQAIVVSDRHTGMEDQKFDSVLKQYINDNKKDISLYVDLGDFIDNPNCSQYVVSPEYKLSTQDEIDMYAEHLNDIHTMIPRAKKHVLMGNHDYARYNGAKSFNKGLASLRNANFENVMREATDHYKIPKGKVEFHKKDFRHKFTPSYQAAFTHGDPRMNPQLKGGLTGARRTAESYPFSGDIFSGHVHEHKTFPRQYDGMYHHVCGMGADVKKMQNAYMNHHPYTQGFFVIKYNKNSDKHFVDYHEVKKGMAVIDNKVYKG